MALKRHRSGLDLYGCHPAGARLPFAVVRDVVTSAPVQFPSVKVGSGRPRFPDQTELIDHWLNVSKWSVAISFSGLTQGSSPVSLSETIILPTGRTATLAEDGTPSLSSSTPIDRATLYRDGATSTILWEVANSEIVDDVEEFYAASFRLDLHHGLWGWHSDANQWLVGMEIAAEESAEDDDEGGGGTYEVTDSPDSPASLGSGACDLGYQLVDGSETQDPETFLWSWTCAAEATYDQEVERFLVDPDGGSTIGSFLGHSIKARTESESAGIARWGLAPTLTVTITESERYSTWF